MKNDFLTLIMTRRSIRAYKPDAVPADVLARVLEAGTYAPSAMGKQSATIVAVETKAYRDRLAKLNAAVIGKDVDPYYGAPVIVVVLGDGESANYLADGSCVLENLMLAAHAEGLGTVWVNREREIFDSPDGKALLRDWGLPETLQRRTYFAFGSAEDHFKYREAVRKAYPAGNFPVFAGYDHMQYQIRDPQGFAELLQSLMERDRLPDLPFLRK